MSQKLRVLVVDDEYFIRNWLSIIVSGYKSDCELIGSAASGEEAISICREKSVELVITDIKMSQVGGLELIKCVKEFSPRTKFIIISNYEDFKYAKEALRLGASDYLLKAEIVDKDILDCINKVKSEIQLEMEQNSNYSKAMEAISEDYDLVKQSFLIKLADGSELYSNALVLSKLKALNINLHAQDLFLIVFSFDKLPKETTEKALQFEHILLETMSKNLKLWFKNGIAFKYGKNKYISIINSTVNSLKTVREQLYIFTAKTITELVPFELSVSAGISNSSNSFKEIPEQYQNACSALDERFYSKGRNIAFYTERVQKDTSSVKKDIKERIYVLNENINSWEYDKAYSTAKSILNELSKSSCVNPNDTKRYIQKMIGLFTERLDKLNKENDETQKYYGYTELLSEVELFADIHSFTIKFIDEITKQIFSTLNRDNLIERTSDYINNNFEQDITLSSLASNVHITSSYLSKLFKDRTGENLINYLCKVRINHSKYLLKNTKIKISDIATRVGYPNVSYFTQVFKRLEGISPIEYRTRH